MPASGTSTPEYQPPYLTGPGGAPLEALRVDVHGHAAGRVVVLVGELDIATVPTLTDRLARSDDAAGSTGAARPRLAADLSGLGFCDCAGLGALVGIHRHAMEQGGWLRLCAPPARIRTILRITGLSRVLLCYPTVAEAFATSSDPERATRAGSHVAGDDSAPGPVSATTRCS
ncbi:anti-anti-sigma factor [Catenulispora sp. EB89]